MQAFARGFRLASPVHWWPAMEDDDMKLLLRHESNDTPTVPAPDSPAERELAEELLRLYRGRWGAPRGLK